MLAEAARNPKVAAIVRAADAQERALATTMMERNRHPDWSESEFQARCEVVGLVFDGLLMRGINHPDIDRPAVIQVLRATMRYLLS